MNICFVLCLFSLRSRRLQVRGDWDHTSLVLSCVLSAVMMPGAQKVLNK